MFVYFGDLMSVVRCGCIL